jgi:Fur family iron response transcriptional regulator
MTKLQVFASFFRKNSYNTSMNTLDIDFPLERSDVVSMLQHYKISPTRQRVEIAEFLFQRPQHLSAEKILDGVTDEGKRVSRATVYNTMGLFSSKGVVREVLIDRERVFYDTNIVPHHHIYNIDTGELSDVFDTELETLSTDKLPEGLRVIGTDVVYKVTAN